MINSSSRVAPKTGINYDRLLGSPSSLAELVGEYCSLAFPSVRNESYTGSEDAKADSFRRWRAFGFSFRSLRLFYLPSVVLLWIVLLQLLFSAVSVSQQTWPISSKFFSWYLNRRRVVPRVLLPETSSEKSICLRRRMSAIPKMSHVHRCRWCVMMVSRPEGREV